MADHDWVWVVIIVILALVLTAIPYMYDKYLCDRRRREGLPPKKPSSRRVARMETLTGIFCLVLSAVTAYAVTIEGRGHRLAWWHWAVIIVIVVLGVWFTTAGLRHLRETEGGEIPREVNSHETISYGWVDC